VAISGWEIRLTGELGSSDHEAAKRFSREAGAAFEFIRGLGDSVREPSRPDYDQADSH